MKASARGSKVDPEINEARYPWKTGMIMRQLTVADQNKKFVITSETQQIRKKKKTAPQATELNPRNRISISRNVWPSEDMIKPDISQKAFSSIN